MRLDDPLARSMATVRPFRALRPHPDYAAQVASVPYDVVSSAEAAELARGKPFSFLHVIRPEIDLPPGTDEHDAAVYEKGAENLRRFAESEAFLEEDAPALYVYRLVMNGRAQTGLFGGLQMTTQALHDVTPRPVGPHIFGGDPSFVQGAGAPGNGFPPDS